MTKSRIREILEASEKNSAHKAIIAELVAEVEDWQSRARQGLELSDSEPVEDPPEPPKANVFIGRWHDDYEAFHGRPYILIPGKDTGNVKNLLRQIPDIDGLMNVARKAWAHPELFNCKQAASIVGFCTRFNDIVAELKPLNGSGHRPATVKL